MTVDPGSFRDPTAKVYLVDGRVLRAISPETSGEIELLLNTKAAQSWIREGRLVASEVIPTGDAAADSVRRPGGIVVEHPRIEVWTYPAEWSFSMLRDAALLQLDLTASALEFDMITKDATPYNVQFLAGRPQFIDLGSFERYREGEPWVAYRQFCQLFLYPLMLQAYAGIPLSATFRASIDGVQPEFADAVLRGHRLLRKGVPLHVALLARAERRLDDGTTDARAESVAAGMNAEILRNLIRSLRKLVDGMKWRQAESEWSDYGPRSHYDPMSLGRKGEFVEAAASRSPGGIAWDIGCNDGQFSRRIAGRFDAVLAIDSDPLVIDLLYRSLGAAKPSNIIGVVANLADPTPGIGWRNRERAAFLDRNRPNFAVALAVVHHLAITAMIPLDQVLDLFRSLDCPMVIEFPTRADEMVQRLLRNKRGGLFDAYDLAPFEAELVTRFRVVEREAIIGGHRVLFEVQPI